MATMKRFLRRPQVQEITGLPESSIYAEMAKGAFPKPIRISANRVAWLEDDVAAWQADKLSSREKAAA